MRRCSNACECPITFRAVTLHDLLTARPLLVVDTHTHTHTHAYTQILKTLHRSAHTHAVTHTTPPPPPPPPPPPHPPPPPPPPTHTHTHSLLSCHKNSVTPGPSVAHTVTNCGRERRDARPLALTPLPPGPRWGGGGATFRDSVGIRKGGGKMRNKINTAI